MYALFQITIVAKLQCAHLATASTDMRPRRRGDPHNRIVGAKWEESSSIFQEDMNIVGASEYCQWW